MYLIDLYKSGQSARQVSHEIGISESQVRCIIYRYDKFGESGLFRPQTKHYSSDFKNEVVAYYLKNNLSLQEVSDIYGVAQSSVCKWLHIHNKPSIRTKRLNNKDFSIMKSKVKVNLKPQTELERALLENERLRTENALLKKVKALVEAQDARLRAMGRKPSKN